MTTTDTKSAAPHANPRVLSIAGGLLFALGLLSFALVYFSGNASPETVRIAAGTGVLIGMGYPAILHASLLKRIAELETRLAERSRPS